jgi:hypothetical protein
MLEKTNQVRQNLVNEPDYVYSRRYKFSLQQLINRYPDGVPDHIIAQSLLLTEEELAEQYESIVERLRSTMGVV